MSARRNALGRGLAASFSIPALIRCQSRRRVYTLGAEGVLSCFELENGALVWRRTLNRDYQVAQNFFGMLSRAESI